MLSKIQSSVILLVGFVFAVFQIWNIVSPINQELVETLINVIFSILMVVWPAKKALEAFRKE